MQEATMRYTDFRPDVELEPRQVTTFARLLGTHLQVQVSLAHLDPLQAEAVKLRALSTLRELEREIVRLPHALLVSLVEELQTGETPTSKESRP